MRDIQIDSDGLADPLDRLQRLSLTAERQGDLRLAARILALAAKERHARPGGGESNADHAFPILTPEQAREELEELLIAYEARRVAEAGSPETRA